ncbi:MAG: sugar phosphate isomerase/epimerase family protein [Verrucomicrobiota bacterium]
MNSPLINRRQFLQTSVLATGGAAAASFAETEDDDLFRISVAPWSLMRSVAGKPDADGIDLWDYPKVVRELGFDALEHDNLHFPGELPVEKDIARMRRTCDDEGLRSTLILCGALGDIADADAKKRNAAVAKYRAWADAAKSLGCSAIRVVCADRKNDITFDEKRRYAVDGIRSLSEYNATLGLDLLIENHGGYSSDPRWLTRVIEEVDQSNCGILADFTHWSVERDPKVNVVDPYDGMKQLAPFTRSVSAHAYDFNAEGAETNWDYFRIMNILTEAGFTGHVAVEYFGKERSRKDGTRMTRELLQRVRKQLA